MSQVNIRFIPAVIVFCLAMTLATPATAQPSFRDSIVQAQQLVRSGTRRILVDELMLDDTEKAVFWPLYDEYEGEMLKIGEQYIALVSEFVDRYHAVELSDEDADRLLDAFFDIQMKISKLRQRYLRDFRKILSGVKVMRFYQLENKVRAEVDAAMALAIPLADPS